MSVAVVTVPDVVAAVIITAMVHVTDMAVFGQSLLKFS